MVIHLTFNRLFLAFAIALLVISCSTNGDPSVNTGNLDTSANEEQPWTYHEFDGVSIFYHTDNAVTYRELLPAQFDMPDTLTVRAFVMDYYDMDQNTEPYLEAAVFLLGKYNDELIWSCVTMPVTSDAARLGGISIGYPKIMGDVSLVRDDTTQTGTLVLGGQTIMEITHTSDDNALTSEEEAFLTEIKDYRNLTIVNGEVFDPKFGSASGDSGPTFSWPELAETYPDYFTLSVGTVDLFIDPVAAADYSPELGAIFGMAPTDVILGCYMVNKFTMRFNL